MALNMADTPSLGSKCSRWEAWGQVPAASPGLAFVVGEAALCPSLPPAPVKFHPGCDDDKRAAPWSPRCSPHRRFLPELVSGF